MTANRPGQPLAGIRVVEAAQMISAPLAASILSDQGAEVIKVESPKGDRMRTLGDGRGGMGSVFHACNRGKKSVVINTRDAEGQEQLRRLIATADVFIQNFRPGAAARMGIDPDDICAANPNLIYTSVSGFGPDGPYADQMVYDFVIQGISGLATFEGGAEGPPRLSKHLVMDKVTALTVAQAITSALVERSIQGHGQHLQVSMLDAGVQFNWPDMGWGPSVQGDDVVRVPHMSLNYDVHPTADGHVTLNLASISTWPRLVEAFGPQWADDPRFASYTLRQQHATELRQALWDSLATMTTSEACDRMRAHDLPGGPVLTPAEIGSDAQVRHNQALVEIDSDVIGPITEARPAARFDSVLPPDPRPAPGLGADTDEVLGSL